jgi:hypothetical protein
MLLACILYAYAVINCVTDGRMHLGLTDGRMLPGLEQFLHYRKTNVQASRSFACAVQEESFWCTIDD